jgi:glycosyltransferase involved in cell wall biosynthesis
LLVRYAGQLRHVGPVPSFEVHRWFQSSDVFVFPSLAEGSAYVTYQALAAGLPMITTLMSGSILRDGVEGFLVRPRDASAIADRLRILYNDPVRRSQMSRAARDSILQSFTWSHYRARVVSAYRAILEGKDPGSALSPPLPQAQGHVRSIAASH